MIRWLCLAVLVVLVAPAMGWAEEHTGVAVLPSGSTTEEALFDASVKLLESSRIPITFSNRRNGEIEAGITVHHTSNAGSAGRIIEDHKFWRLSFRTTSERAVELKIVIGSVFSRQIGEISQFVRNLVAAMKLDPATVSLTIDGETRPLSGWP